MSSIKFGLEIKFGTQYGQEEEEAVLKVLRNNAPTSGDECIQFEKDYAAYCGAKHARVVSNGSSALFLSMIGIGIRPGDRVVTSPITWIATAAAPDTLGAKVDFVDIDPDTYNIDVTQLEQQITPATRAILPVHLYGQSCDMDEIMAIATRHQLSVVEDAAHAIGAEYKGRKVGTFGTTGCFSFHEQKNISTLGEGGLVVTNDDAVYEKVSLYRSQCTRVHGNSTKYCKLDEEKFPVGKKFWWQDFDDCGYNFRMTDIQAAVGIAQLKKVDRLNQRRIENAAYITQGLQGVPGLKLPVVRPYNKHVYHLYPVMIDPKEFGMNKEDFIYNLFHRFGIKAGFHYIPLHYSTAFQNRGYKKGQFPQAEKLGEQLVTLPINPRQTEEALAYLVKSIKEAAQSLKDLRERARSRRIGKWFLKTNEMKFEARIGQLRTPGTLFSVSAPVFIARSPGRLDLMGGNDDYTGGLVFESTIREATYAAAQLREDNQVVVKNITAAEAGWQGDLTIGLDQLSDEKELRLIVNRSKNTRWAAYVLGNIHYLKKKYPEKIMAGLTLYLESTVPLNRGVSSSAAIEVAVMKASSAAYGIPLAGVELAMACQWVENTIAESACGIMDQIAVVTGQEGFIMPLVCQPCNPEPLIRLPEHLKIWGIDSGVSHQVAGIEYEAARASAFMGYKIICDREAIPVSLDKGSEIHRYSDPVWNGYLANLPRSVFREKYESVIPVKMDRESYYRDHQQHVDPFTPLRENVWYHVRSNTKYAVEENHRVQLFAELSRGAAITSSPRAFALMGELMYQSHYAYTECGLGARATDLLVNLCRKEGIENGIYGAKITGGGAGGTVAILAAREAGETIGRIFSAYAASGAGDPYLFEGSSDGADKYGIVIIN